MRYKSGYKYQLCSEEMVSTELRHYNYDSHFIKLHSDGILLIRSGYAWDGPSGPTFDTKNFMRGSLIHDALYQLIRMEVLPQESRIIADKLLYDICLESGMSLIRAKYVYYALRMGGKSSSLPQNKKQIQEVL